MTTRFGVPYRLPNGKVNPEYNRLASDEWRRSHGVPILVSRYGVHFRLENGRINPEYTAAQRREKGIPIRPAAGDNKYGIPKRLANGKTNPEYAAAYIVNNPIAIFVNGAISKHRDIGHRIEVSNAYVKELAMMTNACPIGDELLDYRFKIGLKNLRLTPSLDRVNNETVLRENNIWIICKFHNIMKSDMPLLKWIDFCDSLVHHSQEIADSYKAQKEFPD